MRYIRNIQQMWSLSNLLNGVLHFDFTILLKKWAKEDDDTFLRKTAEEKQNSASIIISVDGKGTVFPGKLKLQGE